MAHAIIHVIALLGVVISHCHFEVLLLRRDVTSVHRVVVGSLCRGVRDSQATVSYICQSYIRKGI